MANGKIPNINNKFYGEKLVEVTFPDSTSSLGFDEYNAVLNNVNSSVSSSIIMDADYALNARIPTNNDRLLSGTAQRMEIQDSNYSSVAWTSPRYVGSQTISARYNDYTPSGSSVTFADGTVGTWKGDQVFNEYPGDETFKRGNPLGKVPAIDLYSTHFVLFDRIQIDDSFDDTDIFHCLYLIDDQGNKQPLTYRNKNLVDIQRLYKPGDNAEVLFLGQNSQNVFDEYPILRVGSRFDKASLFRNDFYFVQSGGTELIPYIFPVSDSEVQLETYSIRNRFMLGNFTASLNNNGNYNLYYEDKIGPAAVSYISYPPGGISNLQISGSLSPWITWLYNQQSNKLFENTLLTTNVVTQEFIGTQLSLPSNGSTPLSPQSQYLLDNSNLKIGDIISLENYNITWPNIASIQSTDPLPFDFPVEDIIYPEEVSTFKVENIVFPGPISASYTANSTTAQSIPTTVDKGWRISIGPGANATNRAFFQDGNGWIINSGGTGGGDGFSNFKMRIWNATFNNRLTSQDGNINFDQLLSSLELGDIIKIRDYTAIQFNPPEGLRGSTLMVMKNNGFTPSVSLPPGTGHYEIFFQLIDGYTGRIMRYGVASTWEVYEIIKYNKPYIELSPFGSNISLNDFNTYMTVTGSAWSISKDIPHEQYIESQYLTGSGVGALIPENYDPKLREQLPDIINKTGIDINSLT
jgi:hypothetical protein